MQLLALVLAASAPSLGAPPTSSSALIWEAPGADAVLQQEKKPGAAVIGIGGGAGGRLGPRFTKRRLAGTVDEGVEPLVAAGLDWLASEPYGDESLESQAITLLAFFGDGHTMTRGDHVEAVSGRVRVLLGSIDEDGGVSNSVADAEEALTQMLCALALTECFFMDRSVLLKDKTSKAVARAEAILADADAREALSDEALSVGLELLDMARDARLGGRGLKPLLAEVRRRGGLETRSMMVEAMVLARSRPGAARNQRASDLAQRAIEELTLGEDTTAREAFRAWRMCETLRASGGDAWIRFGGHRRQRFADLQIHEGTGTGAFGSGRAASAKSAAAVLALEAEFRFRRAPVVR